MATPDRTDELIRAMLERRSEAPVPAWLADRTMHAVTTARQVKRGRRGRLVLPTGTGPRIALVAGVRRRSAGSRRRCARCVAA